MTRRRKSNEAGMSIVELMVACTVMLVGMTLLMRVISISMNASAFARHTTEATVLAEDKMEALRTIPLASLTAGSERVDASRRVVADGRFIRTWNLAPGAATTTITVTVSWTENGENMHDVVLKAERAP